MNIDIFKTTVHKTTFSNKVAKKELLSILKRCKQKNILNNISNIGGYQTKSYSNPTLDKYFETPVNDYLKTLKFRKPVKWYVTSLWLNENNNNDYNKPHTHIDPKNHFACVWYLEVPKNSGKLFLEDGVVITRAQKPTSLEFHKKDKSLTRANALETQKIIESHLKIDYKTFMSSMILGQHNNVDFLSATPEDKRTIVKNFLNLDELFGVREKIRSYKSSYNSEAKSKVSVIKEHLGELKRLETKVSDIEQSKQGCDFPENIKSFDPSEVVRLEKEYDAACREIFEAKTAITRLDEASHELILKINKGVYEDNEE